jgi:hypothetical protein
MNLGKVVTFYKTNKLINDEPMNRKLELSLNILTDMITFRQSLSLLGFI